MRALQVTRLAPAFEGVALRDIPRPEPGPDEVLVRVRAASLNFPDLLMTRGEYQRKPDLPFTLGGDLSGVVEDTGEEVTGMTLGAFADWAVLPRAQVRPKPGALSHAQAAAFGVAYLTAWTALVERGRAQAGEWLLVHGASGGVGLAAVDLGKALGLRVIAAGASPDKLALVEREYRPDAVIDVREGFREQVKALTGGAGADLVYDPVGGDVFDESVRCTAFDGRILAIGFASGRIPVLPVNQALIRGISLVGVRAGEAGRRSPERRERTLNALHDLAEAGRLKPRVDVELPLEDWREGFERIAGRRVVGKIVFDISQ